MKNKSAITLNNRFAAGPILIFALTVLFSSLCFIFKIPYITVSLFLAAAAVIALGIVYDRSILVSCLITLALSAASVAVAGFVYDLSFDGMYFHKEAVHAIATGWNPLYTPLAEANPFGNFQDLSLWLDNYPKGVWSLYACVYSLCGKIEYAKGINMIFVLILFFTAYDSIKTVFNRRGIICVLLALVFTANPVIVSQYFTFMNDLPVAALMMTCGFFGMKIFAGKADNWDYISLAAVFASSFAVKFTAPVLCGITLAAFGIATAVKYRGKGLIKPCAVVIAAALAGVVLMGTDPYVKHMLAGQHPVYPVMGEGKYDIMNTNAPAGFEELSNPEQLLVSIFSCSSPNPGDTPVLKIPFTVHEDELWAIQAPDVRLNGFGVWFSGLLIISVVLGVLAAFKSKNTLAVLPALIVFTLLGIFFPESWWARYSPYVYYIPCLLLLAFAGIDKGKPVTMIVSLLFLFNSAVSGLSVLSGFYNQTQTLQLKLEEIRQDGRTVQLKINDFPCHALWFEEYGIPYELAEDTDENEPLTFSRTTKYWFK